MVSINGLPPARIPSTSSSQKARKNSKVNQSKEMREVGHTSKVANAVSHTIKQLNESDLHRAQVQYDLPEGRSRKAMEEYMDVMNHSRKEELAKMLGVDIYI
ncbi:chromosome partitioning protein ParA [Vibrio maerlii]|uniref:chromosome partitioning protein ParA n=1 Tax=Vibrio maerlii TaxID=2231648 RepID=UPI000E3D98EA|nr:chromosome partitioning protein ParA [Vibrio maerlii]